MTNFETGRRLATLHDAILTGLARAAASGLTKPADVSFSIQVALDAAGLTVVRAQGWAAHLAAQNL